LGAAVVAGALLGLPALVLMAAIVGAIQIVRGRRNLLFLVVVILFAGLGAGRAAIEDEPRVPLDLAESTGAQVEVQSLPTPARTGDRVLIAVTELAFGDGARPGGGVTVLARLPEGVRVAPGDRLDVVWTVEPLAMVGPGYGSYVASRGAVATANIWWVAEHQEGSTFLHRLVDLRYRISDGLREVLPGDAGALASGIVTGDDSALDPSTREAFLRTGTAHITAVSGSNVAMLLAIWNLVIPGGRNRRLLAVQVVVIISIWLYAIIVGLEPPALRAGIMATLVLLASRGGRRPDVLTLLALTSAGMVLWNPDHVQMPAFWLSVVATGALIMRMPTAPGAGWRPMLRGTLEGVALAQIATLPVVLATFGTWSLTSVLANWILAPLTWLAFPLCFVLAVFVVVLSWIAPVVALAPLVPLNLALQVVTILGGTMPPLNLANTGLAGILAVALPCAIGVALLSSEARRWAPIVAGAWQTRPIAVSIVLIGPAWGLLAAILLALILA